MVVGKQMKSFHMMWGNNSVVIVELSFKDILKLAIGRELYLARHEETTVFIRQTPNYEAFNLAAPKAK